MTTSPYTARRSGAGAGTGVEGIEKIVRHDATDVCGLIGNRASRSYELEFVCVEAFKRDPILFRNRLIQVGE